MTKQELDHMNKQKANHMNKQILDMKVILSENYRQEVRKPNTL